MFKLKELESKTRKELQKLSKENNLKANGKNAEMIQRLMTLTVDDGDVEEEVLEEKAEEKVEVEKEIATATPVATKVELAPENADHKVLDQEPTNKKQELPETPKKLAKVDTPEEEKQYTPRTSKRIADQETKSLDRGTYAVKKHKGDTPKSASQAHSKSKIPGVRKYGLVRRFPVSNPVPPSLPLQSIPLPRDNPQKARFEFNF
jgi:hypothetical protein